MADTTPFELTVSGSAMIPHPAERAIINVTVSSTQTNKAAAVDEVVTTAKHIESMLREFSPKDDTREAKAAAALAHWNKTSLSSTSFIPQDEASKLNPHRRYRASIQFDIRFKEFKALGSFGGRISALPHVEVQNIDWILTSTTEESYRPQLRRESAKDAMRKAEEYCEVLGCTNLRPVELTEDGRYSSFTSRRTGGGPQHITQQVARMNQGASTRHMMMQSAPGYQSQEEYEAPDDLEFRPQEVKMTKEITIKFHADAKNRMM